MAANASKQPRTATLAWVTSLGGPLILVPESACRHWQGAPIEHSGSEGDYGRACAVDGYIGLIDVGPTQALVLGEEPADTTFLPEQKTLLRWCAAESADDLVEAAIEVIDSGTVPEDEELIWAVHEPLILFDSAFSHKEITSEEHLRIELTPGRYTVRAAYIERPKTWMILVRFT
ncbi:Imm21 family immunity protein [Microtetraspora malaysiensis]|uniref:Imm21 family immunity protein n=1 Tax=Microtetraspora malaysiensis TaxID=161358 RepID=UPI003D948DBD